MIGTELRQWRVERDMAREELAYRVGVSVSTVYRWETGRVKPSRLAERRLKELTRSK